MTGVVVVRSCVGPCVLASAQLRPVASACGRTRCGWLDVPRGWPGLSRAAWLAPGSTALRSRRRRQTDNPHRSHRFKFECRKYSEEGDNSRPYREFNTDSIQRCSRRVPHSARTGSVSRNFGVQKDSVHWVISDVPVSTTQLPLMSYFHHNL